MAKTTISQNLNSNDVWKLYGVLKYTMKMCGIDLENYKSCIFVNINKSSDINKSVIDISTIARMLLVFPRTCKTALIWTMS